MSAAGQRKVTALVITLVYGTLLSFGARQTTYSKTADLLLLGFYFVYLAAVSVMLLWDRATGRPRKGQETMCQQWRRWTTDDYSVPNGRRQPSS